MSFIFDKNKDQDKHSPEKDRQEKRALHGKCVEMLQQIREKNEELFRKLNRIYRDGHSSLEVPRKKLQGFYGQLMEEWSRLTQGNLPPTPEVKMGQASAATKPSKINQSDSVTPKKSAPKAATAKAGAKKEKAPARPKKNSAAKSTDVSAKAGKKKAKKSSK